MRVSDPMFKQLTIQQNAKNAQALFEAGEPLMTGRRVNRPSDDPIAAARIAELDRALAKFGAYEKARTMVELDLTTMEGTLQTAQSVLGQLKELAVQMVNDTYNADDRAAAATAAAGLRDQLIKLANTQQADGRYLFAGVAEGAPAYDVVTGAYQGSAINRELEILPGLFVEGTLNGAQTFGGGPGPTVFEEIDALIAGLQANDQVAIQQSIGNLDTATATVGIAQSRIGGALQNLDLAAVTTDDLKFNLLLRRSSEQDPDIATQASMYSSAEQALTASIELSKKLLTSSLLQWLR
ncbi:MAG: flagellin [Myxococcales bacterium]